MSDQNAGGSEGDKPPREASPGPGGEGEGNAVAGDEGQARKAQARETRGLGTGGRETQTPETQSSEMQSSEMKSSEVRERETQADDIRPPETRGRESSVSETQNVAAQGGIVSSMTALSRVMGLIRDIALSHVFGATAAADAFFVAFRIPNFFRRLSAEGAFAQAFVPVLAEYQAEYRASGSRAALAAFIGAVQGNFALLLFIVTVVGVLGAPGLVALFAPGFLGDGVRFEIATQLVRVTFPYLAFISLVAFAGSMLNSVGRFAVPAFSPVLLNASLITAAVVVAPQLGNPALVIAWGVFVAGVLQLLFHLPALRRAEMLFAPRVDWRHSGVRKMGKLLLPALFAASAGQVNALVGSVLASMLPVGRVSWLYYADRLMELPVGLVAIALGTVLLPNLSRMHGTGNAEGFRATLEWGVRVALLLTVPAAVGLFMLATPLIATVFLHGEMTATDVAQSALALKAFAAGLLPLVLTKVAAPGYFSRQDTQTPFRFALASVITNIVLSVAVVWWWEHVGLAAATAAAAFVHAFLLLRGLSRDGLLRGSSRRLMLTGLRVAVATAVMAAGIAWWLPGDAVWFSATLFERIYMLAAFVVLGMAGYLIVLVVLGVRPRDIKHRV